MTETHSIDLRVTFGDCDPAGIVFYPRIYGWFDRCFHDWLAGFGGHAAICAELGAVGLGLMGAEARFLRPMRPDDRIGVSMTIRDWRSKALVVDYAVTLGAQTTATGTETRGLFRAAGPGLVAGELGPLRALLART